jgi:hypothetical protein
MDGGRILALREFDGFRNIISVRGFQDILCEGTTPLSTLYYGEQMMFRNDTEIPLFLKFLSNWVGVETVWTQLKNNITETAEQYREQHYREPEVPVSWGCMTLIDYGYDPMRRYWLQFAGVSPLFRQDRWWVENSDGDDYNPPIR